MEPSINEPNVRVLFYCYKSIINDTCVSKQDLITNAIQTDGEPFKHSTMPTDHIILFSIYLQHEKIIESVFFCFTPFIYAENIKERIAMQNFHRCHLLRGFLEMWKSPFSISYNMIFQPDLENIQISELLFYPVLKVF